jgi:hypothetical protein
MLLSKNCGVEESSAPFSNHFFKGVPSMRYKREEPFRYEFNPPLSCTFSIVEIDNKNVNTGNADGQIIDLSPKGVKLVSKLNIPLGKQEVKIKLNFRINIETIYVVGILVWRKELNHLGFQYGVKFVNISVLPEVIMEELKIFIKQKMVSKITKKG